MRNFWMHTIGALIGSLCLASACKEVSFNGTKFVPKPLPSAAPAVPVWLEVVKVNQESWSKSCLYVIVNGNENQAVKVGCNKGQDAAADQSAGQGAARKVRLPVDPTGCNRLTFTVAVYKFRSPCGPDNCADDKNYNAAPTYVRSSKATPDLARFFKFQDARTLQTVDPAVKLMPGQHEANVATAAEANAFVRTAYHKWVRIYFEDQTDENFNTFQTMSAAGQSQQPPTGQPAAAPVAPSPAASPGNTAAIAPTPASLPSPVPPVAQPTVVQRSASLSLAGEPLSSAQSASSVHGVDYNDLIFDIKTENIKVQIDGTPFTCQ